MKAADDRYQRLEAEPMRAIGATTARPSLRASVSDLVRQRPLLGHLVRRDLKARYKDSVLGVFWSLARPLTQLFIYYLVLGKFLGAERGIPDFAIYIFTGLTAYGLFSEIVSVGASSVVDNGGLVKKVYFPREILPLATVGSALVNFAVQMLILVVAMIALGSFPNPENLLYFFPALLLLLLMSTALALILSAMNVYLRDIKYLVEVCTMILMWASPIVYSWDMVRGIIGEGLLLQIYTGNPLTVAILGFQRALWGAGSDPSLYPDNLAALLGVECGVMALLLIWAYWGFRKMQGDFAQSL